LSAPTSASTDTSAQARRFGGVARLLGDAASARLREARVTVVGLGGVGSWAAEALARSGVGALTLIDLDHVAESNLNRQIQALGSTLGAAKGETMARRIADIAPECAVTVIDDFVTPDNCAVLLPAEGVVLDAIDAPRAKAAMIALCRTRGQPIVVCGGAGAVRDAFALRRGDLARTRGDPLLASVRARLRREHGFPREAGRLFRVQAVWFEAQRVADQACAPEAGAPLACAGYGSIVTVTGALGFAAASVAMELAAAIPAAPRPCG